MVTPFSKQARGFAMQICIILKGAPDLELGESKAFPPLKILTAKTVGTYIAKNKSMNAEEVLEVLVEKVVKKAATKRRPAPAVVEPAAKNKRTTVGIAALIEKDLSIIPVVQNPETISVVPTMTPRAQRRHAPKRKLVLRGESDDETVENIIKQVLMETADIETEEMETIEPVVIETTEIEPDEMEISISSQSEDPNFSSSSSSSDSPMHFTADDIPEISSSDEVLPVEETNVVTPHISLPTVIALPTDCTEAFAQLRDTVDQISLEQVQTIFHIDELKAALSKKISNLETTFLTALDNQDQVVLVQKNFLRKEMQVQKDAISKELNDMRKELLDQKAAISHDLLEFQVESQENFNTLHTQLSEIIAYINRVRDDKRGEVSSSHRPQPPDDRSKPGPGDSGKGRGSSSESTRKRGSGYRGGGSTSSR
ncbi:hypothetical protein F511_32626 [Dorcoceras hygrometricum]|uniref:Uncharacterized protein n=1 Tax=Dorcoceras hygrometricum TaxID=472368 RepID=A0A2Z7CL92_9LAMI|nr:hypothetical protein F511_32626 [Dorcoceras hygrometricum]